MKGQGYINPCTKLDVLPLLEILLFLEVLWLFMVWREALDWVAMLLLLWCICWDETNSWYDLVRTEFVIIIFRHTSHADQIYLDPYVFCQLNSGKLSPIAPGVKYVIRPPTWKVKWILKMQYIFNVISAFHWLVEKGFVLIGSLFQSW